MFEYIYISILNVCELNQGNANNQCEILISTSPSSDDLLVHWSPASMETLTLDLHCCLFKDET